jgi:hypothetical protein
MTQATGIEVIAPADPSDDYCRRILPAWKGADAHIEAGVNSALPGFPVEETLFVF